MFEVNGRKFKSFGEYWLSLTEDEAFKAFQSSQSVPLHRICLRGCASTSSKEVWDKYRRMEKLYGLIGDA